jgi:hypothetical protein
MKQCSTFSWYFTPFALTHKYLKSMAHNQERLKELLAFCTGSTRVPAGMSCIFLTSGGFAFLRSDLGIRRFTLVKDALSEFTPDGLNTYFKSADVTKLPKAQTCFNSVTMPPYDNYEDMVAKFDFAVKETLGFAWNV